MTPCSTSKQRMDREITGWVTRNDRSRGAHRAEVADGDEVTELLDIHAFRA